MHHYSSPFQTESAESPWVTVSFVPEDLAWFQWVLHHLERYPVPAGLAGAATPFGFLLPKRIELFPDRWNPLNFEGYPAALETTRFLLLIVSPNSAHAPWIDDHRATFRHSPGANRIVVMVVEGTPAEGCSGSPDWLPAWLRERWCEDKFSPATPDQMVIVDTRGPVSALSAARNALLSAVLLSSPQDLERLGGLVDPLDLSRSVEVETLPCSIPAAVTSEVPASIGAPAKTPPVQVRSPLHRAWALVRQPKPAWYGAGFGGMLAVFSGGWASGRAMLPAAPPPPPAAIVAAPEAPLPAPPPAPAAAAAAAAAEEKSPPSEVVQPVQAAPEVVLSEAEIARRERLRKETDLLRLQWNSELAAGDKALKSNRVQQAADLYHAALITAERYLALRGEDLIAFAEVARHCRKLGAVQTQVASAGEARASYLRGRQLLLALETRGALDHAGKQCLREMEMGLQMLPRE